MSEMSNDSDRESFIEDTVSTLRAAWLKNPELRLGQLIVNALSVNEPLPAVFYADDKLFASSLRAMSDVDFTASNVLGMKLPQEDDGS